MQKYTFSLFDCCFFVLWRYISKIHLLFTTFVLLDFFTIALLHYCGIVVLIHITT
jgi:hypothetical protein